MIGVAIAWIVGAIRIGLRNYCADDPSVQTVLSVLTPFAAYLAAESVHASGILAVVAAGLYAGWNDFRTLDAATRQHAWEVWEMLLFAFNGLVFLLLGITVSHALSAFGAENWRISRDLRAGALGSAHGDARDLGVSRGVSAPLALAAGSGIAKGRAIRAMCSSSAGPACAARSRWPRRCRFRVTLSGGEPFPGRELLIFLAASTIVLTLVLNGLTLPLLVRAFGVRGDRSAERERRVAEIAIAQAGTAAIERELSKLSRPEEVARARDLLAAYARRTDRHTANAERAVALAVAQATEQRLLLLGLDAERRELYALRDAGTINDETLREIETRLDSVEIIATDAPRGAR